MRDTERSCLLLVQPVSEPGRRRRRRRRRKRRRRRNLAHRRYVWSLATSHQLLEE